MLRRADSHDMIRAALLLVLATVAAAPSAVAQRTIHVWEVHELAFAAEGAYDNPYAELTVWVDLEGPGFSKRVYAFWDGGDTWRVRLTAPTPGEWTWTSGSDPEDAGLGGRAGSFSAEAWTEAEVAANPTRRGFLRASASGHALDYADGSPFFMVGDTWLAGSTWRLPFRNAAAPEGYVPGPGIGFEDAVAVRKRQGFNSVSMIAAFPNWEADLNPSTYADENGVYLRNAWEKWGYDVADGPGVDASGGDSYWGTLTAKSMRDEVGNLPFAASDREGVSDFDRINPAYFQSLDRKMDHLADQGFVPLLETVRRDVGPSWQAYFDFDESFARYVQYLVSRYGAHNVVFSGIHLDWIPDDFSLTADEWNAALTYHLETYGPPPFGQPVTALIDDTTLGTFGHGDEVPWLTLHSVGNKPRDHGVADSLRAIFQLDPPLPAINFEPYYTGWDHEINRPGGERPPADSDRDNYFARAQMYGSVLAGGLSGHVHGTAAYDLTSTGEPAGGRPHIWDALRYRSADYMAPLRDFVLSEGAAYQDLELARDDVRPNAVPGAHPNGLDGWAYMMRTADRAFALLYLEHGAGLPTLHGFVPPTLHGFAPGAAYTFRWVDPATGAWHAPARLVADASGALQPPPFPATDRPFTDWAAKLTAD